MAGGIAASGHFHALAMSGGFAMRREHAAQLELSP